MAHVLRLIGLFILALCASPSFAVVPLQNTYQMTCPWNATFKPTGTSQEGLCNTSGPQCAKYQGGPTNTAVWRSNRCFAELAGGGSLGQLEMIVIDTSCPANSVTTSDLSACTCLSGYIESSDGKSCVRPPDACDVIEGMPYGGTAWVDFGIQSRPQMQALPGTQQTVCAPAERCMITGTVSGCGRNASTGRTFCDISNGTFDGGPNCTPLESSDEPPPSGPDDEPPDDKPPAPCPAGKCMGTVNGVHVCVPCGETSDKPPKPPEPATPPDPDNPPPSNPPPPGTPGGASGGGGSNTTTTTRDNGNGTSTTTTTDTDVSTNCTGKRCTTTTTTTTTTSTTDNSSGEPTKPPTTTSRTDETEESRDDFCKKNPNHLACKGNQSSFGGSCGGQYVCEGDAIQCAIARDQLLRNCQAFEPQGTEEEGLYGSAKGQTGNVTGTNPNNATFDVSVFATGSPLPSSGSGVEDLTISIAGQSVVLPFSKINTALGWIGNLILIAAWLVAYRIVTRG